MSVRDNFPYTCCRPLDTNSLTVFERNSSVARIKSNLEEQLFFLRTNLEFAIFQDETLFNCRAVFSQKGGRGGAFRLTTRSSGNRCRDTISLVPSLPTAPVESVVSEIQYYRGVIEADPL